ncbi:MAG: PDZ domain-containing protein [Pyrinomonadaceae bacterium]
MLIRSFASILIIVSSFVIVTGQTPEAQKTPADKSPKSPGATGTQKLRDLALPSGIDLQFLIKELARDMDLNVLFDSESFRGPRKTSIDIRNVTTAEALSYLLLQEGLYFEEAGPKTILVASRFRGMSIPQIGVGITPLTDQLAQYFGVEGGILINLVRLDSPAWKAGLKAGDVVVVVDGVAVRGTLELARAINGKNGNDVALKIVRNRKAQTVNLTPQKGIQSIL